VDGDGREEILPTPTFIYLFLKQGLTLAQAELELMIILPLPPKCWDYRHDQLSVTSIQRFLYYLSKEVKDKMKQWRM
jgi:hypothetical protein